MVASQLKALNAYHANPQAFAHASKSSMIGKLATYRDAVLAAQTAQAAVTSTSQALSQAQAAVTATEQQIAALKDQTAPLTTEQQTELSTLTTQLSQQQQDVQTAQQAYDAAVAAAQTATQTQSQALSTVSNNRDLSPQAIATLNEGLGL